MSLVKKINVNDGSGREFEDNTVGEMVLDTTPQLGSFNGVTSDGVARAISGASGEVPVINPGDDGKVLTVVDGAAAWDVAQGGSSYTAGDGIKIESGTVSAYHGETLVDKALPLAFKTGADTRAAFIGAGTWSWYTALKVEFGDINPNSTLLKISIKDSSSQDVSLAMPYTSTDPDLGGKKVKVVFANPDNPSNYIEANSASNVEITQGTGSQGSYNAKVSVPAVLFDDNFQNGFNWHGLTLADIQGADGTTLMYAVACASDGTLITTGSYGPTDNLWTVGFGNGYMPSATTYALVEMPSNPVGFEVANPVPSYSASEDGKVLGVVDNKLQWVNAGGSSDQPLPAVATRTLRFEFENMSFDPTNDTGCNYGTSSTTWAKVTEATTRNIWDCTLSGSTSSSSHFAITEPCRVIDGNATNASGQLMLMQYAFSGSTGLKSFYATGNVRESSSSSTQHAFDGCINLESFVFVGGPYSTWADRIDMGGYMFNNCYRLKRVAFIPTMNTNNRPESAYSVACRAPYMFANCVALESIEGVKVSHPTGNGSDYSAMFLNCQSLKSVDGLFAGNMAGLSGSGTPIPAQASFVTCNAYQMFKGCHSLQSFGVPLAFGYPSSGTFNGSCESMFEDCAALTSVGIIDINGFAVSAKNMFKGCRALRDVSLINTQNIANMESMFDSAGDSSSSGSLLKLPVFDMSGATNVKYMFRDAKYADGALTAYNTLSVLAGITDSTGCFTNCGSKTHASDLAQIPASWGGTGA